MERKRTLRILKIASIAVAAGGVFGLVVKSLWNWVMPALFGLRSITFWQAWGVLILSRILFSRFSGGSPGRHARARMLDRWEQMSPEERAKLRERLRHRWGACGEAAPEAEA
jgi:hypothetical protein